MARLVKLDKAACEELSAWLASKNEAVIDASYTCVTFRHSSPISLALDYEKEPEDEPVSPYGMTKLAKPEDEPLADEPLSLAEMNERSA